MVRLSACAECLRALLEGGLKAVFVGSGTLRAKDLRIPGRNDFDRIHAAIEWLQSIASVHGSNIGTRALIIGVGKSAMEGWSSALRLGAREVKDMARYR